MNPWYYPGIFFCCFLEVDKRIILADIIHIVLMGIGIFLANMENKMIKYFQIKFA